MWRTHVHTYTTTEFMKSDVPLARHVNRHSWLDGLSIVQSVGCTYGLLMHLLGSRSSSCTYFSPVTELTKPSTLFLTVSLSAGSVKNR